MKNLQITKLATLTVIFFLTISVSAQKRVQASDIINDIKRGKTISYKNATIVGILDFTFMDDKIDKLPKRRRSWWKNNGSNIVKELIKNKISFVNCTFEDSVFAYLHDEDSRYTFVANFDSDVIFRNCTFKEKALFKYSHFSKTADFSYTKFNEESTFKWAKFKNQSSFSNTTFKDYSTFKYAEFSKKISFAKAVFNESATFKYAKFKNGVSFNKTRFDQDLDMKYTKVYGDFDITDMHVEYRINSKYTKINGKKFHYN